MYELDTQHFRLATFLQVKKARNILLVTCIAIIELSHWIKYFQKRARM